MIGRRGKLYGLFVLRTDGGWESNLCNVVTPAQLRRAAASAPARGGGGAASAGCG